MEDYMAAFIVDYTAGKPAVCLADYMADSLGFMGA
jgi:hypothetical protein